MMDTWLVPISWKLGPNCTQIIPPASDREGGTKIWLSHVV